MSSDLAVIVADQAALERLDRDSVVALLERGKSWLQLAVERDAEVGEFVEAKAQAETIRTYTLQKQLGKDAELAATELVRRAERGIGIAIRRGQDAGEISSWEDTHQPGVRNAERVTSGNTVSPQQAAGLKHRKDLASIYKMADLPTDEQFEEVIAEAKAEGNLSRANIVRKVTGEPEPVVSARPDVLRRTRHHDVNRIVEETVNSLAGLCMGVDLARPLLSKLDMNQRDAWASSLRESLRLLNRFAKEIEQL